MKSGFDVAVVGGGVMGCATAWALAERGLGVVLLERFEIGHRHGSSHGGSRIFRFSYPDPHYVAMAQESLELWRALERKAATSLIVSTGGFDTGKRLHDHVAALEACGAPYELLTAGEAGSRWPDLLYGAVDTVLYQPDGGMIHADEAWRTFTRLAVEAGVDLRERTMVEAIHREDGSLRVRTESEDVAAGVVVVTAGGWSRSLLAPLGIFLETNPTRETVAFFDFPHERFPTLVDWGTPAVYALPAPGHGLKVGEHIAGATTDPDDEGSVNEESVQRLKRWVASWFPEASRDPRHVETCIYTNTTDEHFILERHGDVIVGSACSGHGFKFAPLIGRRLAALASR